MYKSAQYGKHISKIFLHFIYSVKKRDALLPKQWRPRLFSYMPATINIRGHFSLAVYGVADHVHLFFDYNGHELALEQEKVVERVVKILY